MAHWMLEEVGAPHRIVPIDFAKNEHKTPDFLALNPMGKLPTIVHRGTVVTETAAIIAYLADTFPQAGLAPAFGDAARAAPITAGCSSAPAASSRPCSTR